MAVTNLKTDYKDSQYQTRKFKLLDNQDGTITLDDETVYTIKGDDFGSKDINTTNERINEMTRSWTVDVSKDGWSGTVAPYSKTIAVTGMDETYEPMMSLVISKDLNAANTSLVEKAYGCVSRFETSKDSITIYCHRKKPATSFRVRLKGV